MRYRTKLLIAAGLLLAMSLSAAALAYWGVAQSHRYLTRSRISHEQLERQLQLSRHSQQLFKALSLIHISEPTRRTPISYAVFCLKKKKKRKNTTYIYT